MILEPGLYRVAVLYDDERYQNLIFRTTKQMTDRGLEDAAVQQQGCRSAWIAVFLGGADDYDETYDEIEGVL